MGMVHYVFGNAATTTRHSPAHAEETAVSSARVDPMPRDPIVEARERGGTRKREREKERERERVRERRESAGLPTSPCHVAMAPAHEGNYQMDDDKPRNR